MQNAKQIELGAPVRITAYQLLKTQQKTDCGKNRQTLLSSMKRMNT
ncbi:hypothetical protein BAZMOX_48536_0 [methanotrophic endosymbiont of Bathymodiolus azoricus (Menez Gwen)]|nr:hypothetical protein BAZMOX_48536_0 [methanotrophic endosymbiont of Bathymodiolus azoricus (Menez Gwen)]